MIIFTDTLDRTRDVFNFTDCIIDQLAEILEFKVKVSGLEMTEEERRAALNIPKKGFTETYLW